jgi:hypothetical protein
MKKKKTKLKKSDILSALVLVLVFASSLGVICFILLGMFKLLDPTINFDTLNLRGISCSFCIVFFSFELSIIILKQFLEDME